jgi:hypothetical protein
MENKRSDRAVMGESKAIEEDQRIRIEAVGGRAGIGHSPKDAKIKEGQQPVFECKTAILAHREGGIDLESRIPSCVKETNLRRKTHSETWPPKRALQCRPQPRPG